jgi:hypothetical protein
VLDKIGLEYEVLDSGCCGMAGSFGYEKDKYDVSIACGERKLLPQVRRAGLSTIIMADGFSCREQIAQETGRHALHLAEVLQLGLHTGEYGPDGMYPEKRFVAPRLEAQKRSMRRAGLASAGIVAGAVAAGLLWKRSR